MAVSVSATLCIGCVGCPIGIKVFQLAIGTVVDCKAEDGHVVGIHDAVDEPNACPVYDHFGCAATDFLKPGDIGFF